MTSRSIGATTIFVGATVRTNAEAAFVSGIQVGVAIRAAVMAVLALVSLRSLRGVPRLIEQDDIEAQHVTDRSPLS